MGTKKNTTLDTCNCISHGEIECKGIFPFERRKLGKGAGFDFAITFVVSYDDSLR
jgi:hypothetical protein